MENEYYIEEYITSRGLSKATYKRLKSQLTHYSQHQGLTLEELIEEADNEEEEGTRWKRRTLKKRLTMYMNYCKDTMALSSAKSYLKAVKGFYNHHEIEIGILPKWNEKNARIPEPILPSDLLTKEILRDILELADPLMKALILFEASSGMTKSEVRRITIKQFLESTYAYHEKEDVREAVATMMKSEAEIIPAFHMRRKKNNKYFITFCSPEATREILNYLTIRDERNRRYHRPLLTLEDPLFKVGHDHYQHKFVELNNALNLPKKGSYNQFRGHMLRKFHATQLEKAGMPRYLINVIQGKSNGNVDDVYFFEDEETLRKEYINALDGVLIYTEVKEITKYSPEYLKMEEENVYLKEQNQKYQEVVDSIDERINKKVSEAIENLGEITSEEYEDLFIKHI